MLEHVLFVLDTILLVAKGKHQGNLSVRREKCRQLSELRADKWCTEGVLALD